MTPSPLQRFKRHTLWLVAAFFLAITYFAARNLAEKYVERVNAHGIYTWTQTSIVVNRLAHELQRERGLSSGWLSSNGNFFDVALARQRDQTDLAIAELRRIVQTPERAAEGFSIALRGALGDMTGLDHLRTQISDLQIARDVAIDQYTALIEPLFEQQLATMSAGRAGWIYRQQIAFIFFLQAKETAGQERALVTAMLSAEDFSSVRMVSYHRIKALEQARLEKFLQLTPEEILAGYRQIQTQPYTTQAERIRRQIIAIGASGRAPEARLPSAGLWFDLTTRRIDAMSEYEKVLSDRLLESAMQLEREAETALWVNLLTIMASLLLAGALVMQIWRGKQFAEKKIGLAQVVFDHSAEAIVFADRWANLVEVNRAFTEITGYEREEAIGSNPRLLRSGRYDDAFYAAMWERILSAGRWEGEIWNRRKNGEIFPALLSIVALKDQEGNIVNFIGMIADLSKHKETEALVEQLRTFDPLTGLPNREAWHSAVDQEVANAMRAGKKFAVLDIGLDRFKLINESLGHAVGDQVLLAAADNIKRVTRRHDMTARSGGDRFSILLHDPVDPKAIGLYCERVLSTFAQPIEVAGNPLSTSVSIGIATYPSDGGESQILLKNAETALYGAKEDGRGCYAFYAEHMNAAASQMLTIERLLRQALENGEFQVVYQPQVQAGSRRLVGFEALLRWHSPVLGSVSPVQFIPVAEATGMIVQIGEWVLQQACLQARLWQDSYGANWQMAVNLSARQFRRENLMIMVQMALDAVSLPPGLLKLEITEGLLMHDPVGAADILGGLRNMGIEVAIDDFGTGYSSLAYLKNFPLDQLKLDRAFVKDLPDNESDRAIAHAVITLGRNLSLQVLAEGVETAAQADFLTLAGCDVFQGYFYGKPMSPAAVENDLREGRLSLT